eukprot:1129381-Pelagomonas_calceolata.AAC.1
MWRSRTFNSWGCLARLFYLLPVLPILRSIRCKAEVVGRFVLVGWGVTKIASGRLELRLT